jgi:two-component system phosphate regulon response regulator OmpR
MTSLDAPLHILVVDDDPDLCSLLTDYLGLHGFVVDTVGDGTGMRRALAQRVPDLVVMDLMLPGEDGLSLVRSLKARWRVPVLMLSARGEEMDRVIGLEVGADDYMPKPFGPRELLARVRALIRRTGGPAPVGDGAGGAPAGADSAWVHFGPFALDAAGHRLMRDGTEVTLTTAEFELLVAMATRPNRVLSRDTLVDLLKGYDRDPFDRSIDNRVTRLRRKIEADPTAPAYIRTVRGEGYLFNPQGAAP